MTDTTAALGKVAAAPIEMSPFPHLSVDDFLPAELYDRFLAAIPPHADFPTYSPDVERDQCNAFILQPEAFPDAAAMAQVREIFAAASAALLDRFRPFVLETFAALAPGRPLDADDFRHSLSATLIEATPGRLQTAHTDSIYRAVTWLLYLPTDPTSPLLGTELFEAGPSDRDPRWLFFRTRPDGVPLTYSKTLEYSPNRLVAFLNGPLTFHGYRAHHAQTPQPERRITMNNYIEINRAAVERLFGDAPRDWFDMHYDHIWRPG